jgi:hypothetical protein
MEGRRLDALSRSLASRGGGGVYAPRRAGLQPEEGVHCVLEFTALTQTGANAETAYEGILTLMIGTDGAIDEGSIQIADGGERLSFVGQATGRSITLRAEFPGGRTLALTGVAEEDVDACSGAMSGAFGGPDMRDLGTWSATALGTA